MRTSFNKAPLPVIGYILTLVGFISLGSFTAALAFGSNLAVILGVAMFVSYALAAGCFMLRARQIAAADPTDPVVLGLDPIRGDTDRRTAERYLARYRSQDAAVSDPGTGAREAGVAPRLADAA